MSGTKKDSGPFTRYKRGHWKKFITQLLTQIKQGESFSLMGMPGIGKTDLFQTFDRNRDFWKEVLPEEDIDFLFIFIDLTRLLDITPLSFYRLLLNSIDKNVRRNVTDEQILERVNAIHKETINSNDLFVVFDGIEEILKLITEDLGFKICILIDDFSNLSEFDRQFFNTLKAIRNVNKWKITLGFSSDRDIESTLKPERLDELWDLFLNKQFWMTPLAKEDALLVMQEWKNERGTQVSESIRPTIHDISGGHIGYMRSLSAVLAENDHDERVFDDIRELTKLKPIQSRSEKFWNKLLPQYREFLIELTQNPKTKINTRGKYLQQIGVINNDGKIFSPLLQYFVEDKVPATETTSNIPAEGLYINRKTKTVYVEGKQLRSEPTKSEYNILKLLYKNKGELVSREDLAATIWGPNYVKKYSDWAIDRVISRLRKKIGDSARNPKYIETVKGRGLRLIT